MRNFNIDLKNSNILYQHFVKKYLEYDARFDPHNKLHISLRRVVEGRLTAKKVLFQTFYDEYVRSLS